MASIVVNGDTSGSVTLSAPAVAGSSVLTLPAVTDTLAGIAATQTLTNKTLTSPVLTTPALGTPSALVLTNATGLTQSGLATGVAGTGPAFSYYLNTAQTGISAGVFTKVLYDTQIFNATSSMFSSSRFTPTVAGYYQINGSINPGGTLTTSLISIFKNGSRYTDGTFFNAVSVNVVTVSGIVYCNGSTDYIELYGYLTGTSLTFQAGQVGSVFNGALVRSAT
jgi:hypothetical protein